MLTYAAGSSSYRRAAVRSIKTLHTPVYKTDQLFTKQALLTGIKLLDKVINSTSYNKSLLYTGKYNTSPRLITSQDSLKLQNVVRELLDGLQMDQAMSLSEQNDPIKKLGTIGLQLFVDCHDRNILPMSTTLTQALMEQYNKYPEKQTLRGIQGGLETVRKFLSENKVTVRDKKTVDALVKKLAATDEDAEIVKRVLEAVDYKLYSDEIVRVVRGRRTVDELDVSKGWKFPAGIMDTNEAYLRSLELPQKKLLSIDEEMLVLVYDGTLRDADKILPTLHHATKLSKSLILMVTGDCMGDALTSIIINNNKNRRQGNNSRTIILKYNAKANQNLSLQENHDLIKFLRLPHGFSSIYSPQFSPYVPSKICAGEYFGTVDSIKATTGETFLYNSIDCDQGEPDNKFLRVTVTLNVGGNSEVEIDQRRSALDNLINNVLCHGLSEGFVPGYGVSLVKAIPIITHNIEGITNISAKLGVESVVTALALPMQKALENVYGYNNFQIAKVISEAIENSRFTSSQLGPNSASQDLLDIGILEPWNKIDQCLDNVSLFIKLLSSCNTIVSQVFEKPKKTNR